MEKINSKNYKIAETSIEGTFGDKIIKISSFPVENNNNVVVNIHGTFGSLVGGNNKYLNFAKDLQENGITNTILYESSRLKAEDDPNETNPYKRKQKKFIGKTFTDELNDARNVIKHILDNSKELFSIEKSDIKITLNGNSLGGIIAFYLAEEFSQIQRISTVGTGLRLDIKDVPILNTFPEAQELKSKLSEFNGDFLMQYGSEDEVFSREAFQDFYQSVGSKEKSFIHLLGVDHTFGKIGGEISEIPYKEILSNISIMIEEGIIPSGEENLYNRIKEKRDEIKSHVDQVLIDKYFINDDEDKLNMG